MAADDSPREPRPRLSDETAAAILDFLYDLAADFESVYFVELQRHYRRVAAREQTVSSPGTANDRAGDNTSDSDDEPF